MEPQRKWKGTNWSWFRRYMINLFITKDCLDVATGPYEAQDSWNQTQKNIFKKKQAQVALLITEAVDESMAALFDEAENGSQMWAVLEREFGSLREDRLRVQEKQRLLDEFRDLDAFSGGSMKDHMDKMFLIRSQLKRLGYVIQDEDMVNAMLRSLPKAYSAVRIGVRQSEKEQTPEQVRTLILMEEHDRKRSFKKKEGQEEDSGPKYANAVRKRKKFKK